MPLLTLLNTILHKNPGVIIFIAYVQRFKRAKFFWKKIAQYFDVQIVHNEYVVDYDCLVFHQNENGENFGLTQLDSFSANWDKWSDKVGEEHKLKGYVAKLTKKGG